MYWMTQSLLSSWLYYMNAEEPYAEEALALFLAALRREKRERTRAMEEGVRFENMVNAAVSGVPFQSPNEKWTRAAERFAGLCRGGQAQTPVSGRMSAAGMEFVLYGVCDYVKAGQIYDIKKVARYEYGKYAASPQHPMYLHLLPEAARFDYLIFDGTTCFRETYRRCDCKPLGQTVTEFMGYLNRAGYMELYKANWAMNEKREEMIDGI